MSEAQPPKHHLGHRLAGWVDGELPPGTRQLVAAHLAMCSTCRVAAVVESRTKAGLRDLGGPAPSNDLMASLLGLQSTGPQPPTTQPPGPSALGNGSAFPAVARRRARPAALAAGVASVAALTVGSAWLSADGTPPPGDSRVRQASTVGDPASLLGPIDGLPDGRPTTSFASIGTGSAGSGPAFVEVLRLR
ncbi:MAG: zf-HC2 domain-containing protein [Sporichthyaceae bacterium]